MTTGVKAGAAGHVQDPHDCQRQPRHVAYQRGTCSALPQLSVTGSRRKAARGGRDQIKVVVTSRDGPLQLFGPTKRAAHTDDVAPTGGVARYTDVITHLPAGLVVVFKLGFARSDERQVTDQRQLALLDALDDLVGLDFGFENFAACDSGHIKHLGRLMRFANPKEFRVHDAVCLNDNPDGGSVLELEQVFALFQFLLHVEHREFQDILEFQASAFN